MVGAGGWVSFIAVLCKGASAEAAPRVLLHLWAWYYSCQQIFVMNQFGKATWIKKNLRKKEEQERTGKGKLFQHSY